MRIGYHWLAKTYLCKIAITGISCILSRCIILTLDCIDLLKPNYIQSLRDDCPKAQLYKWLDFVAWLIPCLAIVYSYDPGDMFEVYNKYPELVKRVSIFQYVSERANSQRKGSIAKTKDFLGIDVNKGMHIKDTELILAERMIKDDDEELLARYRLSVNT